MNFKRILFFIFFITSCTNTNTLINERTISHTLFSNKGFALVYDSSDEIKKIISKKIDSRSLTIYQKNLKSGTEVKIVNLLNNKSIVAKVGLNAKYPNFYNSVLSERIANEIDLDINEPYVQILTLNKDIFFIAKKAKIYDEEKQVANKAPVDGISINDLSIKSSKKKKKLKQIKNFSYIIKIVDFYYEKSANSLKNTVLNKTNIKNIKINKLSENVYRVYAGPYNDLISLKKAYNDISQLEFENIEIIKLWKN